MEGIQIIEGLNRQCNNSLSITMYGGRWNIHSYREGTLLQEDVYDADLTTAIDKALKVVKKADSERVNDIIRK